MIEKLGWIAFSAVVILIPVIGHWLIWRSEREEKRVFYATPVGRLCASLEDPYTNWKTAKDRRCYTLGGVTVFYQGFARVLVDGCELDVTAAERAKLEVSMRVRDGMLLCGGIANAESEELERLLT